MNRIKWYNLRKNFTGSHTHGVSNCGTILLRGCQRICVGFEEKMMKEMEEYHVDSIFKNDGLPKSGQILTGFWPENFQKFSSCHVYQATNLAGNCSDFCLDLLQKLKFFAIYSKFASPKFCNSPGFQLFSCSLYEIVS